MRFKVTIAFTIVVSALFVISLIYEGKTEASIQVENDVREADLNQLEQVVTINYSDFSSMYVQGIPAAEFLLKEIE